MDRSVPRHYRRTPGHPVAADLEPDWMAALRVEAQDYLADECPTSNGAHPDPREARTERSASMSALSDDDMPTWQDTEVDIIDLHRDDHLSNGDHLSANGTRTHLPATDRVVDGATFLLDDDQIARESVWGTDGEIAWERGEPLLIVGPTGVGKTTLEVELIAASVGLTDQVLGLPVEPCERPMLFALDRPRQIAHAMMRVFGEQHRALLHDRLVVSGTDHSPPTSANGPSFSSNSPPNTVPTGCSSTA